MEKSPQEIEEIKQKYKPQIDRMDKMLLNKYSIANIRYWYACLSYFPKSGYNANGGLYNKYHNCIW